MDDSFGLILIGNLWYAILLDIVEQVLPLGLRGEAFDPAVQRWDSHLRRCVTLCITKAVVPLLYVQIHI